MDKLSKKLIKLKETLVKAMKQGGLGGSGSVKAGAVLPSINKLPKPGNNSNASKIGIPGIAQPNKKDPLKVAEQTQNKDIKDIKMKEAQSVLKPKEMVKFEKNGQWSIEKSNSIKPNGENIYDSTANIERKKTRTSEVREDIGQNKAVRQYTSASMGSAREQASRDAARARAKSKKMPVKVMVGNQIPQEIRDRYEKKGKS